MTSYTVYRDPAKYVNDTSSLLDHEREEYTEQALMDVNYDRLNDAMKYQKAMISYNFVPESPHELVTRRCCVAWCSQRVRQIDVIRIRCGFYRSLRDNVTAEGLRNCILAFLYPRFDRMLRDIVFGEPFVTSRKVVVGVLGEQTIRSIARIGVETLLLGQFNPLCGSLMLARGESKKHFLRTNSRHGTLTKANLAKYIGVGIRRRGVDSFMRCDVCVTLNQDYKKLASLVRMFSGDRRSTRNPNRGTGVLAITALAHQAKIISMRKLVLYSLFRRYVNARKDTAKARSLLEGRHVSIHEIPIDEIVPTSDVQTDEYIRILNEPTRKKIQEPFRIDKRLVRQSELMSLTDEDMDLFVGGYLHDEDFSLLRDAQAPADAAQVNGDQAPQAPADAAQVHGGRTQDGGDIDLLRDDIEDVDVGEILKRIAEAATLAANAKFANSMEHRRLEMLSIDWSAERMLTYAAFETGAKMPASVLAFTADGLSKEKTKLPNKEKGKNDETIDRLECYVTGLQMCVSASSATRPDSREKGKDLCRIRELTAKMSDMKKHPTRFTDEEKLEVEEELRIYEDKDAAFASGYQLINNDFIYPYGWGGSPSTDALISNLLHVLRSRQVAYVPNCIALVLDNASVNKSINTLRAFGMLLELIPRLREVHLYFPTVGHTHNSLDAHFGALTKAIRREDIGTPTDVRFDNKSYLRFAESLSHRVQFVSSSVRDIVPLSEKEMENGCPLFVEGSYGKAERISLAKKSFPRERDPVQFAANSSQLMSQLKLAGMGTEERRLDLEALAKPRPGDKVSLYDLCCDINAKAPAPVDEIEADGDREKALATGLRMRGRSFKANPLLSELKACKDWASNESLRNFIDVILTGDDGSLRSALHEKIHRYQSEYYKKEPKERRGLHDFRHGLHHLENTTPLNQTPPGQVIHDDDDDEGGRDDRHVNDGGESSDVSIEDENGVSLVTTGRRCTRKRVRGSAMEDEEDDELPVKRGRKNKRVLKVRRDNETSKVFAVLDVTDTGDNNDEPESATSATAPPPPTRSGRVPNKKFKYTPPS